jgi:hypothetical protein
MTNLARVSLPPLGCPGIELRNIETRKNAGTCTTLPHPCSNGLFLVSTSNALTSHLAPHCLICPNPQILGTSASPILSQVSGLVTVKNWGRQMRSNNFSVPHLGLWKQRQVLEENLYPPTWMTLKKIWMFLKWQVIYSGERCHFNKIWNPLDSENAMLSIIQNYNNNLAIFKGKQSSIWSTRQR